MISALEIHFRPLGRFGWPLAMIATMMATTPPMMTRPISSGTARLRDLAPGLLKRADNDPGECGLILARPRAELLHLFRGQAAHLGEKSEARAHAIASDSCTKYGAGFWFGEPTNRSPFAK